MRKIKVKNLEFYYDNELQTIMQPALVMYPRRFFYRRRYKKGDRVELLVSYMWAEKGATGVVRGKSESNKGSYIVIIDFECLTEWKKKLVEECACSGYGIDIRPVGIRRLKK